MRIVIVTASVLFASATLAQSSAAPAPAAPSPQEAKARAALGAFKKSLKAALVEGMKTGAASAIDVCAVQAPRLAAAASGNGVLLGRSAVKVRNAANAPRPWVADVMNRLSATPRDGQSAVVDLGRGRVGYAETILVQPMCLACHGSALSPQVSKALAARYPADKATGFKEGDFRGVFWAEVEP